MYINLHIKVYVPKLIERISAALLLCYRKRRYGYAFRRIKLIQANTKARSVYAIVDPQDYEKLAGFNWVLEVYNKSKYAVVLDGKTPLRMHRVIMNAPKNSIVDHKDRNGLNNTRQNLRFATRRQNNCNTKRTTKTKSSKYKGVIFVSRVKKWRAKIRYDTITRELGYFDNEEDAAKAYDSAAKELHGEFAVLNFP